MRALLITAAATFSAVVLAIYLWRIEPLLPERGGTTCFAADYSPARPVDLSSPRRDQLSVGEINSLQLGIHFPPDEKPFSDGTGGGYDWRYSLRLRASLASGERLSSAATCEWRGNFTAHLMPALFCYIDCDGGMVTVRRKIGQNALAVRFEAGERLKTGGSCDGSGGVVFIGAEKESRDFR
jgi:hypothetical protein